MANTNVSSCARALAVGLLAVGIASALAAPAPKLYRWVGADGKPYYSDQVPPEAMDKARQELSVKSGLAVGQVDRALTPEERAAAAAKVIADAAAAKSQEDSNTHDQALLTSYPTEADLKRAYDERILLEAENLKTTRFGIENLQQNLSAQLITASNLELNGKPVAAKLADSIQLARKQLLNLQALRVQHADKGAALQNEYRSMLEHYRSLQSAHAAPATDPGGASNH